ncbi:MAG: hypothetical protein CSB16_00755 [Clostridiales bacterium]|nr:MAG: hypothetical protein CSB16_00755 [Clostridiales bacterium]
MQNRLEQFTLLINNIYRSIQKIKLEELKKFGLKGSYMTCIHYLGISDRDLSFKELCNLCGEDKSLISKNLKSLIELEIVNKDSEGDKIYKSKFALSQKGKEIFEKIEKKTNAICSNVYLDKSENELQVFYSNLKEISAKLNEEIINLRS